MQKTVIHASDAPRPVARYSQGIRVGNTLYVQGLVALDPRTHRMVDGPVAVQAERVFASLRAILEEAGMTLADVVKVTAFLASLDDYAAFNEAYNRQFQADPPPVRTTVQAALPLGARLEVEAIAAI